MLNLFFGQVGSGVLGRRTWPAWIAALALGAGVSAVLVVFSASSLTPVLLPAAAVAVAFVGVAMRWPTVGLVLAGLCLPLDLLALPLPSGALSPAELAFVAVAGGWAARALNGSAVARPSIADAPIVGILAIMLLGLTVTSDLVIGARVLLLWCAFYGTFKQAQSLEADGCRAVIVAFTIGAGVLGGIGAVLTLLSGPVEVYSGGLMTGTRSQGTFADPNYFACILVFALLPGLALILGDPRRHLWLGAFCVAAFAGLALSLSRGGAVGLAGGLLVLLTWTKARRTAILAGALVLVVVLAAGQSLTENRQIETIGARLGTITDSTSTTNRRPQAWAAAFELGRSHPVLGVGLNEFELASSRLGLSEAGRPIENAHNQYLSLLAESGIIGVVAFLALLAQFFVRGVHAARRLRGTDRALGFGLTAAAAGFSVNAMTIAPLRVNVIAGTFLLFAGLAASLSRRIAEP